jgi:hypothetical protein
MSSAAVSSKRPRINGTNRLLFLSLSSGAPLDGKFIGVHVDDVAIAHVRVLTRSGSTAEGYSRTLFLVKNTHGRESMTL